MPQPSFDSMSGRAELEPPQVPPEALRGMEGWEVSVVWALNPDIVTRRLVAPDGEIRYLKVARLGQEVGLSVERDRMVWAADHLPVPRVLAFGADREHDWLLTEGLPGVTAIDGAWLADPARLVPLLADGLRRFHALSIEDCPFDSRLDKYLLTERERLSRDPIDTDQDLRPELAVLTPQAVLAQLERLRPEHEDLVVCHGDYCLPNVLISDGRVTGYIDLGALGVADRWGDLATATWSVTRNLGPGWEDLFLKSYGVQRDARKMDFYRLLYEPLP